MTRSTLHPIRVHWSLLLLSSMALVTAGGNLLAQSEPAVRSISEQQVEQLAGNAEVAEILRNRPGRGVLADQSQPTSPEESIKTFQVKQGLSIELIAAEPKISQPLFLSWDSSGRMWVVQYRQYQYPAGLKIVRFDQHLRAVFDKVPAPPPNHVPGADIISVLEDTDHDGRFDRQQDVITGLNIATSVAIGRGGIWVLNPPYLLYYPDGNQDSWPDSDPQVHLSGFGLQDTHSVANSLLFGPDGWLYGSNGSTTGGTVVSAATPATEFEGQCIWRYHPETHVFEIYAEGGGNTFSLDIDAQGRVFSGTNGGSTRGFYYPQGSYSQKNWGKHGALTNPFAFGFFEAMRFEGDSRRFPQAFMIYDGGLLGKEYSGSIVAPNSMHNLVWHSRRYEDGSTFRTVDEPNLVESSDRWFRPVYAGAGPDGAIYIADWYDTRLSHVSPVDDWHKESGRIYRIAPASKADSAEAATGPNQNGLLSERAQRLQPVADLSQMNTDQLIDSLLHVNKWVRQRAALELGWQGDQRGVKRLVELIDQTGSLDALWALNGLGQLTRQRAAVWLNHSKADIRRWVVRLLGDRREGLPEMIQLAKIEQDLEVRSQLAATAKRLPASVGLSIVSELLQRDQDLNDLHLPLMYWWAVEAHADDFPAMLAFLSKPKLWQRPLVQQAIAARIVQRYAATGTAQGIDRAAQLLSLELDSDSRQAMLGGLSKAFLGRSLPPNLPSSVQEALREYRHSRGSDGVVLAARQGDAEAQAKILVWLKEPQTEIGMRMEVAQVFGEINYPAALETLIALAVGRAGGDPALQRVALQSLAIYDEPKIALQLTTAFDSTISDDHGLRETASRTLASRKQWALVLLQEINGWRIRKRDIPPDVIAQLRLYDDPDIVEQVDQAFGKVESNSPDQLAEIQRILDWLHATESTDDGKPAFSSLSQEDAAAGQKLFADRCGKCHQLFGQGETVGPRLDSYDRGNLRFWLTAIVAPSIEIREGYQMYQVVTVDGRVLTGMVATQDLNSITLRNADQKLVSVALEDVDHMQAMKVSLMPDGLLKDLNERQVQQLFAYLTQATR